MHLYIHLPKSLNLACRMDRDLLTLVQLAFQEKAKRIATSELIHLGH